jgi:hypothetical protein
VEFDFHKIDAVAAGTILLALATFILALFTFFLLRSGTKDRKIAMDALEAGREQAKISERHTAAAEKTLESQIQPVLIEIPVDLSVLPRDQVYFPTSVEPTEIPYGGVYAAADVGPNENEVRISVPLLNAGRGIAKVEGAWIELANPRIGYSAVDLSRPNVPVGTHTRAQFFFREGEDGFRSVGDLIRGQSEFLVALRYSDVFGRQTTTTRLTARFRSRAHMNWEIDLVDVGDPDFGEVPPPGALARPQRD